MRKGMPLLQTASVVVVLTSMVVLGGPLFSLPEEVSAQVRREIVSIPRPWRKATSSVPSEKDIHVLVGFLVEITRGKYASLSTHEKRERIAWHFLCTGGESTYEYIQLIQDAKENIQLPQTDPEKALGIALHISRRAYEKEQESEHAPFQCNDYQRFEQCCSYFLLCDGVRFLGTARLGCAPVFDFFTKKIVDDLVATIDGVKDRPVEVISVTANGLYTEMVAVGGALKKRPAACITLHLIGAQFQEWLAINRTRRAKECDDTAV